jgi:hypothetical protein
MKRTRRTGKRRPIRVDYENNAADHQCALLGSLGFSTKFIIAETGLTECQTTYRLHKAEIRRSDYRNGVKDTVGGSAANLVLDLAHEQADRELKKHLRATLTDKDLNIVSRSPRA